MRLDRSRPLLVRLFVLAILILVPPVAMITFRALGEFERGMVPELDKKAAAIGRDITAQVERAVDLGIPIDHLVGVDEFFRPVLMANPELRYLAISAPDGRVLFVTGAPSADLEPHYREAGQATNLTIGDFLDLALPVQSKGERVAAVHVGFDQGYIASRLSDIFYDIAVVLVASLIVAFEILLFVVFFNVTGPMKLVGLVVDRARRGDFSHVAGGVSGDEVGHFVRTLSTTIRRADDQYRSLMAYIDEVRAAHFDKSVVERVAEIADRVKFLYRFAESGRPAVLSERLATDIRLPLFLFVFAEEMGRAFMPLYAREFGQSFGPFTQEMLMALPITMFMVGITVASPWAGSVIARLGTRRVFLTGLIPAAGGYFLTAFADSVVQLIVLRIVSGLGYALVTVACQTYISRATLEGKRAQGLGIYVGAVLTASICGTAMGGVLAERVGFDATFVVSAALAAISGWLVHRLLDPGVDDGKASDDGDGSDKGKSLFSLFANWRFTALLLFAAVPAKMALTGFLFFLVPVILWRAELSLPEIGRTIVLYPLIMAILSAVSSRISDLTGWRTGLVAIGGLIGGLGLLLPLPQLGLDPSMAVALAIIALGVSHGLSASPQLALVPDLCWIECHTFGRTRVLALVRTVERLGSIVGPVLAAAFIPIWGLTGAVVALGGVVLVLSVIFVVCSFAFGSGLHLVAEEDGE
ncbi:putative Multidrug resistance protein mdtG [Magnetospirillum sp. LM-5]|uniref:MFS transporter n=1 Tax=Magnetospirillum sp. LM-5 TaxID=2681466 RepID=UPI001385A0E9|nr:MFS transporter [Magnetospirillum sp. LM-5]CAA7621424.1 putative Multidrug resistance protein mdtG [Magnetospirillum sp. LM-5]